MSDTKLRDLERRWKETGTVEDEAAYLLERVRVGDLTHERLELAAYCGHEAAVTCCGSEGQPNDTLQKWVSGLARWGRGVQAWVAWRVAQEWRENSELPADEYRRFLDVARAAQDGSPDEMTASLTAYDDLFELGVDRPLLHALWLAGQREPDTQALDLSVALASETLDPGALLLLLQREVGSLALAGTWCSEQPP